jgi:putative glycosyltransferase (TIGR04372 family)
MWKRQLRVLPIVDAAARLNRFVPGHSVHTVPWARYLHDDPLGVLVRTKPHLQFELGEIRRGEALLQDLGIPDGSSFVCFLARDPAYLDAAFPAESHREESYRDCSINSYLPAVAALVDRGHMAIRMGAVVNAPLPTDLPGVVDYATLHRSEFMDVFLFGHAHFVLASTTGATSLGAIFRKPIVLANATPMDRLPRSGDRGNLFIPKLYWSVEAHRLLTLSEIRSSGAHRMIRSSDFDQLGIELIDNTDEEITEVALEMDDRLAGRWEDSREAEELQNRYWRLLSSTDPFDPIHYSAWEPPDGPDLLRVGHAFLARHVDLLV